MPVRGAISTRVPSARGGAPASRTITPFCTVPSRLMPSPVVRMCEVSVSLGTARHNSRASISERGEDRFVAHSASFRGGVSVATGDELS